MNLLQKGVFVTDLECFGEKAHFFQFTLEFQIRQEEILLFLNVFPSYMSLFGTSCLVNLLLY